MKNRELIKNTKLKKIAEKVQTETAVDKDDILYMLKTNDILELGIIADHIRKKINGNRAYYGVNCNLNYTNICELKCPLCAYYKEKGEDGSYLLSIEQIKEKIEEEVKRGVEEVHIVGGLNSELKIEYFENMLRAIKSVKEDIFIVAFTAVEYHHFAENNNMTVSEVFKRFIDAGLGALPGGGAEIFARGVRDQIAPNKISGERWLEIMGIAHSMGLKTNATMLYNHIESHEDIADHLIKLRNQQDKTGGFKTFVPLPFHAENTEIESLVNKPNSGFNDIRIYAASRIALHNFPHIKALWMYLGDKMAQVLLSFGVDDMGATYNNEKVVHSAGAKTSNYGTEEFLINLIETAGMDPVKSNAGYNEGGK